MVRRRARKDANQDEIVEGLRDIGATVKITHQLGNGFVDLCVGFRGFNYLFEVKDGDKPPSERRLTEDEQRFFDEWQGQRDVIEYLDDALEIMEVI